MTAFQETGHGNGLGNQTILSQTLHQTPGLRALIWMSDQGEIIHSAGQDAASLERVASFAKGIFDIGARLIQAAGCGEEQLCFLQASSGAVAMHRVDDDTFIVALADESARQGTLVHGLSACARTLTSLM